MQPNCRTAKPTRYVRRYAGSVLRADPGTEYVGDTDGVLPESGEGDSGSGGGGDDNPPGGDPCLDAAYLGDGLSPDFCGGEGEPGGGEEPFRGTFQCGALSSGRVRGGL